jgi:hypothetical protein
MTNPARQMITAAQPGTGSWTLARRPRVATPSFVCALLAVAALSLAATPGWAQPAKPAARAAATAGPAAGAGGANGNAADVPKVKVERGAGGKKIYRITEDIRIEGKIQKPEAFFFYQKSSINYDWQELKQDFLPRILDSVNGQPF